MIIINNHTHSIRQKKLLPLPLHFNADDHNIDDLKVCILKCNFKDTKHRKLIELQFVINFETNKFGFYKDISFLRKYDTFMHKGEIFSTLMSSFSQRYAFLRTRLSPLVVALSLHYSDIAMFLHHRRIVISRSWFEASLVNVVRRLAF